MVGHDAQRTARGTSVGPAHPHLLWTYRGLAGPPLIGPDGSVYSWGTGGLSALTALGQRRWTVTAQEYFGGPAALGPDGMVRVSGELPMTSGTPTPGTYPYTGPHMAIFALLSQGQRPWTIRTLPWATVPQSVPFSKGQAPLVTSANLLYVPFVGPVYGPGQNNGVEVISPGGTPLRRLLPGWSGTIALGRDGTVYEVGSDSQGHAAVLASRADGALRWSHPATYAGWGDVLIGRAGAVYVSDGAGLGRSDSGDVAAYTPRGRLLWHRQIRGGTAALAERSDGIILVATGAGLTALSPHGTRLWERALGAPPTTVKMPPSLAVDAAGRAYVGSGDGLIRAIAPTGTLLWTLRAGSPAQRGDVPSLALGPAGVLAVTATDGVLRLYR